MNNQQIKGFWKILEDYPSQDKEYLVVFPDTDGSYHLFDCDVWEFKSGEWRSLPDSRMKEGEWGMPSYYIDLPMPGA